MMNKEQLTELLEKQSQELRRGLLVLAVLSQLNQERYGYSLINRLAEKGLDIDQGTLYPLLRRLEDQGLLQSEWNVEGARPRRYYQLNKNGEQLLARLKEEWNDLIAVMDDLL